MYYPWYFDRSRPVIKSVSGNNAPHAYGSTFTVSVQVTGLNQGTHAPSLALDTENHTIWACFQDVRECCMRLSRSNVRDITLEQLKMQVPATCLLMHASSHATLLK